MKTIKRNNVKGNILRLDNDDIQEIRKMSKDKTYRQIQNWFRQKYPELEPPSLNTIGYHVNRLNYREEEPKKFKDFFESNKLKFKKETQVNYFKNLFKLIHKIQRNKNYSAIFTECFFKPVSAENLKKILGVKSISSLNQFQHFMNRQRFEIIKRMSYDKGELVEKIDLDKNTPVYYYVDLSSIYKNHPSRKPSEELLNLHANPCFRTWLYDKKLSEVFDTPFSDENERLENFRGFVKDEDKFFMLLTTVISQTDVYKEVVLSPFLSKLSEGKDIPDLYEEGTQSVIHKNRDTLWFYLKKISRKLMPISLPKEQGDIISGDFVEFMLELVQVEPSYNAEEEKFWFGEMRKEAEELLKEIGNNNQIYILP
ncbi:MAG: hypothetical protein ABID38_05745 [Candidatus Diapherotrites archaeon]